MYFKDIDKIIHCSLIFKSTYHIWLDEILESYHVGMTIEDRIESFQLQNV